jgi:sortase B
MQFVKKGSTLLLTLLLLVTIFAGCNTRDAAGDSSATSATSATSKPSSSQATEPSKSEGDPVSTVTPKLTEQVVEFAAEVNDETVGWLRVPGTNIDDAVVQNPDDATNLYYERLNYDLSYSFNGVYWADFRGVFGDGSREQLGVSTCIYGHALTDVKTKDTYNVKFAQLHNFRDEQFAKENPYIYFSTGKEDMAFEIIAVFTANVSNPAMVYNGNTDKAADYVKMIEEEIFPRSKYNYNVELSEDDKFITLSTCIYTLDNGFVTEYPDTYFRYVIMGRLVDADEPLKEEADFMLNPNVLVDNDDLWPAA